MLHEQTAMSPIVVMGVSGSGKTRVGRLLAEQLGAEFIDADDLHSVENKAKMSSGIPLTDEDRVPWLRAVADAARTAHEQGRNAVVACSALRRSYRDLLREASGGLIFVHLDGSREVLAERLGARKGHFMPAGLLDSQLATLERLDADESGLVVDVSGRPDQVASEIVRIAFARSR